MLIRSLDPKSDRTLVTAFFLASADYVQLERGGPPDASVTDDYFTDAPPGCDPAESLRLGLFDPDFIGLAELSFGYPAPEDAYIGLLMIAPMSRGSGAGARLLHHLQDQARNRACALIHLGVLQANPRGRAFWEREGFTLSVPNRPVTIGQKTQIAHRLTKLL